MELQQCLDMMENKGIITKNDIGINVTQKFKDELVNYFVKVREKLDGEVKNNKISIEEFHDSVIISTIASFFDDFNNEEMSSYWEVISKFEGTIKMKKINPIDVDTDILKEMWEELKIENSN